MARIALIITSVLLVCAIVAIGILVLEYTKCQHKTIPSPPGSEMNCGDTATTKDDKYMIACQGGKATSYGRDKNTGKNLVELANGARFTHGDQVFSCYCPT
jgi:hypothetical protein